ncbi:MAG: beta-N-acetylhexosaminidase [Clostridia bacterium]|nr:beta-N-acetylhexosaminidase [Clostridia bacterium]
MKRFGVMLDMSRNAVMKPDEVKNYARVLKSLGYNMIQLYTEDTYEVEGEPYFGYLRGRYSEAELCDIVKYCDSIGVEVIPCIQTLAHLNQIFRWKPYGSINDTGDILLVEEERTYELIENMFKTLAKCFTSKYVHIGMDEAHMLGLGKYLDKHGTRNRFDILSEHLTKVSEIATKYGFKPIMWSDMFFRLANHGAYYVENPSIDDAVKASVPENVGLVYWDYYHDKQEHYEKMMRAHLEFDNEIWFAGGAWTWKGFAGSNAYTMQTMCPAMRAAHECGVENIFMTMWGDNGKECSFYSVLPSLYAIRRYYDGETDMDKIKAEFKDITGEDYDGMTTLDLPDFIGGDMRNKCSTKPLLYNDPFLGAFDSTIVGDGKINKDYLEHAKVIRKAGENSKNYGYIFESHAALCELLAVKYDLGFRTRKAYKAGDKNALADIIEDYETAIALLDEFYLAFRNLWFKENKPHGFDVQDIRLGGLKQRLISCKERLVSYVNGDINSIDELEEELLCYYGGGKEFNKTVPYYNGWTRTASPNII